jgi:hemoglobin
VSECNRPDIDSRAQVEVLVDAFYDKVLADPLLAPIFLDIAQVDLAVHLPHIKDYWCKLLLGDSQYQRHTMSIHRQLHGREALTAAAFARWLRLFCHTVDEGFQGPQAERAKQVAATIARNMAVSLPASD